ncbi:NUDIX hydrolase [Agromyces atrinae]|uniref:8-oxo-dGTP diphosphatase n=1 Tax=Agromyces atrinae TaxID=592376 RepID=A0A4Q2M607_9MICO|nr:NUDIX domain-containing protein [Agromyces atrinae]NYD66750.1 8-oxo-dGTP diphosphatase [Agromyces atrinae]RXZ87409.1 NUDIX hydrolase [Agromyces atrinae]
MTRAVYAAGALCWRFIDGKLHVLVIHRTVYGDVTIPKGKVDPGETLPQTAVREIAEETGIRVRLGVPLGVSSYPLASGREKVVHYWAAQVTDAALQRSTFVPNGEVAALEWVTPKRARGYLTYSHDVDILEHFERLVEQGVTETFALIVMRHGKAMPHGSWSGPDSTRPLAERGVKQASALVETVRAWNPKRIVSSPAVRCVTTVTPLSVATGIDIRRSDAISQDAWESGDDDVRAVVGKRVRSRKSAVLCSHGPVLPEILREIALATTTPIGSYMSDAANLETGAFSVVHLSSTNPASGIIAIETYPPLV